MKTKVIRFKCPKCSHSISILAATSHTDGKCYLVGECINCNNQVIVDIDSVVTVLLNTDRGN